MPIRTCVQQPLRRNERTHTGYTGIANDDGFVGIRKSMSNPTGGVMEEYIFRLGKKRDVPFGRREDKQRVGRCQESGVYVGSFHRIDAELLPLHLLKTRGAERLYTRERIRMHT